MTLFSILAAAVDPQGWTITIVGWAIVLVALIVLSSIFSSIPKIINYFTKRKLRREGKKVKVDEDLSIAGEVNAAIAMALHLHFAEMHDEESNVITIKKITKRYSPWSSKIYNMNTYQNRYRQ